jgi:hypothetical protein
MRQPYALYAILSILLVAGCKPSASTDEVHKQAAQPIKAEPNPVLNVDPAEMPACDKKPRVATLRWDASSIAGISPPYEIWVSYPNKESRLFARGPAKKGEILTGKWIVAGAAFSLKNSDGSEIANTTVAGTPCN